MLMQVGRTSSGALAAVLIGGCIVIAAVAAVSAMPAAEPAPTAVPIAVSARATPTSPPSTPVAMPLTQLTSATSGGGVPDPVNSEGGTDDGDDEHLASSHLEDD